MLVEQDHPIREVLPLYVFGLLEPDEAAAVDEHLQHCLSCGLEVRALREASMEMQHALSGPIPHPRIKQRLMASIERSKHQPEKAGDGIFVYREVAMQNSPFPGVEFRVLYSDLQTGMMTSMLKLAAGSSYPAHEHAGAEQSYVIEGSCHIGDLWLSKGEFAFAEAGSRHDVLHSDEGCLLLIVSSKHDKLLDLPKQAAL